MVILGLHWLDLVVPFDILTFSSFRFLTVVTDKLDLWLRITCVEIYINVCILYVCATLIIINSKKVLVVTFYVQSVITI